MVRACMCDVCHFHRQTGSVLYTTSSNFGDLSEVQQKIQLDRHLTHGVCPHLGPPFRLDELTHKQQNKYKAIWDHMGPSGWREDG